jgi:hypothetical protein
METYSLQQLNYARKFISFISVIVAIGALIYGNSLRVNQNTLDTIGVKTKGMVHSSFRSTYQQAITYDFFVDGTRYRGNAETLRNPGTSIEISYDPQNPIVNYPAELRLPYLLWMSGGTLLGIFGIMLARLKIVPNKRDTSFEEMMAQALREERIEH